MFDVTLLSRIQFAVHIGFHYLYPPLTIGLSIYLVIMEGMYLATKKKVYERMARFWVKIFSLIFALGVATGVVNVFAFGTNWSRFSYFVGDVFGALLGAEGIFAFTLEAGFLGVLLFGWDRVGPKVHFFSTCMVALGAHFSATWIVFANSWMQTPAGYEVIGEGLTSHVRMTNFWEALFNPTALLRLGHVLIGCWLAGTFLILSVSAYYLLKRRHFHFAQNTLRIGFFCGTFFVLLQLWSADVSGRAAATFQPAKLAAMEGVYDTEPNTAMTLIGWTDPAKKRTYGIKVPGLLSFLVYRKTSVPVLGLDQVPVYDWPVVMPVFQSYHWMIYMWVWMFLMIAALWVQFFRGKPEKSRFLLRLLVPSILAPMSANIAGWICCEMGRQPWVVYGLLRTSDGVTPFLHAGQVWRSLIMFIVILSLLFILFLFLLDRKIKSGPEEYEDTADPYRNPYISREVSL